MADNWYTLTCGKCLGSGRDLSVNKSLAENPVLCPKCKGHGALKARPLTDDEVAEREAKSKRIDRIVELVGKHGGRRVPYGFGIGGFGCESGGYLCTWATAWKSWRTARSVDCPIMRSSSFSAIDSLAFSPRSWTMPDFRRGRSLGPIPTFRQV